MYVKNVEGFEGEGEFMSKFGVQLNDQLTLTVARKRFDQIRTEKLTTEVEEYAKVEVAPKFEGRQIMMILVPQVAK